MLYDLLLLLIAIRDAVPANFADRVLVWFYFNSTRSYIVALTV
jgi:hypothetical protein